MKYLIPILFLSACQYTVGPTICDETAFITDLTPLLDGASMLLGTHTFDCSYQGSSHTETTQITIESNTVTCFTCHTAEGCSEDTFISTTYCKEDSPNVCDNLCTNAMNFVMPITLTGTIDGKSFSIESHIERDYDGCNDDTLKLNQIYEREDIDGTSEINFIRLQWHDYMTSNPYLSLWTQVHPHYVDCRKYF